MATKARLSQYTIDTDLQLKDAGALTATAALQVASANKILDMGGDSQFMGVAIVDVSAITINDNNELYSILVEGSDSATFASGIEEVAALHLGANEVLTGGGDVDSTVGRYVVPFVVDRAGRTYRYLRGYVVIAGTTPSINFQMWLGKI